MRSATFFITLSTMTALCSPALGGVIQLPQTGQAVQQSAGDDGALKKGAAWPVTRFVSNPDQTITDNLTGLVWNSDGNTATPTGQCGTSGTNRTWSEALAYVACLNTNVYRGFTDWRLPSITELETLPSAGQPDSAAWLNSQGFSAVQTDFYWSSTSDAALPADFAWTVQISSGATFSDDKTLTYPVIAVRRGPVGESLPNYPANNRKSGQSVSVAAGDDGALQRGVSWPAARFTTTASGSGVVNDNLTRLIWLRDAGTPTVGTCSGGPLTWPQALDYVVCLNGINYQGRSDWRLPNRAELESLVDYSASGPALSASHPFTNLAGSFWSSTSDAADPANSAWYLTPFDGGLFTSPTLSAIDVWPVSGPDATTTAPARATTLPRTGQTVSVAAGDDGARQSGFPWPVNRFSDNGQTQTDTLTGLEWSKDADAPPAGQVTCRPANGADMTWQEALGYVACLNANSFQGHADWRLPTVNELESLTDAGAADGTAALETRGFTTVKNNYWSSTTDVAGLAAPADAAWTVRMTSGEVFSLTKDDQTLLSAWPVRTASGSAVAAPWQSGQKVCYDAAGAIIACTATGQDGQLQPGIAWPEPRFANAGQTTTDMLTGLVWPTDASTPTVGGCTGGILSWTDAVAYVACLNSVQYLGASDWRLPNRKELRSLINYGASQPALAADHPFTAVSGNYWSSTGKAGDATTALSINLAFADQSEFPSDSTFAVLPVRGGQNIAADKGYLDFGTPDLETAAVSLPLTITNRGMVDLGISAATVSGTNSALFSLSANTCTGTLAPGSSCSVTATFSPAAEGFKEGALTITSTDPDTPSLRLPLTATVPDKRSPSVSLASPQAGFTNKRDKVLTFSTSDGDTRVFMNGTLLSKVSGDALPLLLDGLNTVRVEATDVAGNTGIAQAEVTFVAPTGELDGNQGVTIGDALRALRVSVSLDPQPAGALFFSGDVAPLENGVPSPNGVIDIADALLILRKVVGLVTF